MQPAIDTTLERHNYRTRLIALVKTNPILWNKRVLEFNNRNKKMQKWLDVSYALGGSTDKIRRTWENLRNQYRRDLKRQLKYGIQPKWRFYDDMSFLRSIVRVKEAVTENSESESEVEDAFIDDTTSPAHRRESLPTPTPPPPALAGSATEQSNDDSPRFKVIKLSTEWRDNNTELPEQQPKQKQQLQQKNDCNSSEDEVHVSGMSDLVKIEIDTDSSDQQEEEQILPQSSSQNKSEEYLKDRVHKHNTVSVSEACVSTSAAPTAATSTSLTKRTRQQQQQNERSTNKDDHHQHSRNISLCTTQLPHNDHNVTAGANDDDYHFVMSILPSLRAISRNRKFPLRMSIMNLIAKELNTDE